MPNIGEPGGAEVAAFDAPEHEGVAGDLHDHVRDALLDRDGEQRLQFGGLGGGAGGLDALPGDAGLDGADDPGGAPGVRQAGFDQVGGGGLAVGAGSPSRFRPSDGRPQTRAATSPVNVRGCSVTSTGRRPPTSSAPRSSVRTHTAPRSRACAANSARRAELAPGRAAKRSPADGAGREAHTGDGEVQVLGLGEQVGEAVDSVGDGRLRTRKARHGLTLHRHAPSASLTPAGRTEAFTRLSGPRWSGWPIGLRSCSSRLSDRVPRSLSSSAAWSQLIASRNSSRTRERMHGAAFSRRSAPASVSLTQTPRLSRSHLWRSTDPSRRAC